MISWVVRTGFMLLLFAVASVGFATVPVGRRTLLEHTTAIFSSRPARQLGRDLGRTGDQVKDELRGALERVRDKAEDDGLVPSSDSP